MRFTSETTANGVSERHFSLDDVPGILWSPADAVGSRPLVLLAHGGGQDQAAPGIVARARRLVSARGFTVAAIDAPGHGERPKTERDHNFVTHLRQQMGAGEPVGSLVADYNATLAAQAVPEWQLTLDALQKRTDVGAIGPVGFWGMALGTGIGVPLVAADPRIIAAVFGLVGPDTLAVAAAGISIPIEFLVQWDDELVPRASALALFDAFASPAKTLHANSGRHVDVPRFELDSADRFFARHLM
jgi:pimeloyl-ACP methyl ester carboxylesterase